MDLLTLTKILERLCQSTGKWGMLVGFPDFAGEDNFFKDLRLAAPWWDSKSPAHEQACFDGHAILLFDTEDELLKVYEQTVGDDGPTKANKYSGALRVYCLTCSPDGQLLSENA